jgi:hypothetical protein
MPLGSFSSHVRAAVTLALAASIAVSPAPAIAASKAKPQPAMQIETQGSFSAGGRIIGTAPNTLHCDHGVVEYQIPTHARKNALFLWHSSGTHVWQQRWDGGEGYQSIFLRRGFPVYLWDGPRVGRANWGCEAYSYTPRGNVDQLNFWAWRLGNQKGEWFPGVQFPKDDAEAIDQAQRSRYDEFDTTPNVLLQADAAAKAIDRIGPSVLVTNSAGGLRAMVTATKSDKVKAIVSYETPAFVFPEGEGPKGPTGPIDSVRVPMADFMKLTRIPIQIVWGDNTAGTFWEESVALTRVFVDLVNAHGGHAEILMLPSVGLKGNTHIAFADLNNVAVADQLSAFLRKNKLDLR